MEKSHNLMTYLQALEKRSGNNTKGREWEKKYSNSGLKSRKLRQKKIQALNETSNWIFGEKNIDKLLAKLMKR